MSAFSPMSLPDGEATPVSHIFSPVKIDAAGVAHYADRSNGIAIGFPTASFSLRSSSKTSRNYKATVKLVLPVLEVVSPSTASGITPAPTKAYDLIANLEFILPERSTIQERKNLLAMVAGLTYQNIVVDGVRDLESVY